jgi:hypothetical protein
LKCGFFCEGCFMDRIMNKRCDLRDQAESTGDIEP